MIITVTTMTKLANIYIILGMSWALLRALAPPAPSVCLAAPARGSPSALQPEDRWGWSTGGPASPRHTQSQLTPEQGACSSSVLRAPLIDSSLHYV